MASVIYRVPLAHHTKTLRGADEVAGSILHPEMTEFAGLATRLYEDGAADLIIFAPKRNPQHVERVPEGVGPGTFSRE